VTTIGWSKVPITHKNIITQLSPKDAEMIFEERMKGFRNVSLNDICGKSNLAQALGNALFLLGID